MFNFLKNKKNKSNNISEVEKSNTLYAEDFINERTLMSFFGMEYTGEPLQEATYFSCIKLLSESIAKLPLKIQIDSKEKGIVSAKNHKMYNVLRYRPNPYQSATVFWGTVEMHRNHYGNAYVLIHNYRSKQPQLFILDPQNVTIVYDKNLQNCTEIWYVVNVDGKNVKYSSAQIMHFRTSVSLDGIKGLSVREQLASTTKGGIKSQKMLNSMYDNNMISKAALNYVGDLNDTNAKKLSASVQRYAEGKIDGATMFLPIPVGCTIQPLNLKFTDAQFLELRKYSALQIAAAFGIKPNQINDYEKSSYASSEAQQLAFYIDTSLYILKQYEDEISYKCLSDEERAKGYEAEFNIDVVLRGDAKTQADVLVKYTAGGIKTSNEARRKLRLADKEGGDKLYVNGSNIPLVLAGSQYGATPSE